MKTNVSELKNSYDNFDHFLSAQLQQQHDYLPDDNFTANVIAQLPTQKKLRSWQEYLIIVVPCTLITLWVLSQFPVVALLIKSWVWLSLIDISGWLQLSLIVFVAGLLGIASWIAKEHDFL